MKLRPWLQLIRLPNLFTAAADIFAGYWLATQRVAISPQFIAGLITSMGLYAAGIIFNDIHDVEIDRAERPARPLPSGRISIRSAWRGAITIVVLSLAAALAAAHLSSCSIATKQTCPLAIVNSPIVYLWPALLVTILLYDFALKATILGPIAMGACRILNFTLGLALVPDRFTQFSLPLILVLAAFWLYVASLTYFGRDEAGQSSRGRLTLGFIGILLSLLVLGAVCITESDFNAFTSILWLALLIHLFRVCRRVIRTPSPAFMQYAMKTLILGIVVFDAVIASTAAGWTAGLCVLALLLPTIIFGRWLYST